ncbi:Arabinanase/levansucrase/invertase [Mycena amicta]|nr:Arabinanase/levansucrase/invertase [Mycena amicta]
MSRGLTSLLGLAATLGYLQPNATSTDNISRTYTNPILDGNYADPWILEFSNTYYLTPTMPDGSVGVFKSSTLDNFTGIAPVTVWVPPNTTTGVWAPELHRIGEEFYIYCALQDGEDEDADRRMHVLRGSDPQDPTAPFTELGANRHAYIAEMETPYSLHSDSERVIHSPYWPNGTRIEWQWSTLSPVYGVNEGPQILVNGQQTFLVYSACGSWDPCYGLAIMGLKSPDVDPLDPDSWWANDDGPVFSASKDTVGTGHASFLRDANGVPYFTYHAWDVDAPAGWGSRQVWTQRFHFNPDGTPNFPAAVASGLELPGAAGF